MKFAAFAATAVLAVAGVTAHSAALPTCATADFTQQALEFEQLNAIIDIAVATGMLSSGLAAVDPLTVANQVLSPTQFSVLGLNFALTPTIKSLSATGISTVVPRHLNVTGASGLSVGADFTGDVAVKASLSVQIAQLNHQWWQLCFTDLLNPIKCPPKTIDVTVDVNIAQPTIVAGVAVPYKKCPADVSMDVCADVTVTDILIGALTQQYTALLDRILRRIVSVSLTDVKLTFAKLNNISLQFDKSTTLLKAIAEKLYNFTEVEVNKHGVAYNTFVQTVDALAKDLLNLVLKQQLASKLGGTCYDPAA